mmetsp:Transcript_1184/g.7734  ORF Transcript_1184/g.7734 Transcript_1184/m.7734 type:complete len:81 (-) Transcript_1184:2619-2861(-)
MPCATWEADVGATSHVRPGPRIRGVLKHRYTDFVVHEVDRRGQVVVLDDVHTIPKVRAWSAQERSTWEKKRKRTRCRAME